MTAPMPDNVPYPASAPPAWAPPFYKGFLPALGSPYGDEVAWDTDAAGTLGAPQSPPWLGARLALYLADGPLPAPLPLPDHAGRQGAP